MWDTIWYLLGLIIQLSLATLALLYLLFLYTQGNRDYWPKRGFPVLFYSDVTSLWKILRKKDTLIGISVKYYEKIKNGDLRGFSGMMENRNPVLMITDLDLIKQILVKDFDNFMDRRTLKLGNEPVINENLVLLEGKKWRDVRAVLSPTFTTGKMKRMFECFNECGEKFVECLKSLGADQGQEGGKGQVQDLVNRFTVDVIGAAAFGIDTGALRDANSEFFLNARKISNITPSRLRNTLLYIVYPRLANFLKLKIYEEEMLNFFKGILRDALRSREESGEKRNDFLQLLVEARRGTLSKDPSDHPQDQVPPSDKHLIFSDDLTMAQSFTFFTAGFDTVGSLISFGAYLMAAYPDIQERIYEEMKGKMEELADGQVDYDAINGLQYLDMFVSEILRRYPPAHLLERKCLSPYKIPGTSLTIPKDTVVMIPVQGIHMDPEFYPDPEIFDPERFSPENKARRNPYTYMPFGTGPRSCIAMRFALIESKVALAYIAYNFRVEGTDKTPLPVMIDEKVGLNRPVAGLELKFTPR